MLNNRYPNVNKHKTVKRGVTKSEIQLDRPVYCGNQVPGTPETGSMDQSRPVEHGKHS